MHDEFTIVDFKWESPLKEYLAEEERIMNQLQVVPDIGCVSQVVLCSFTFPSCFLVYLNVLIPSIRLIQNHGWSRLASL